MNNTKTKNKLILALIFLFVICSSLSFLMLNGVSNNKTALAETFRITGEVQLKDEYVLGDELVVPTAEILYQDNYYAVTESVLTYPSGNSFSGQKHTLNAVGDYVLKFKHSSENLNLIAEKKFKVNRDFIDAKNGVNVENLSDLSLVQGDDEGGLSVELTDGSEFVLNQPIDLTNSNLTTPLITVHPYNIATQTKGQYDEHGNWVNVVTEHAVASARIMFIRLTDCYNPNNYVEISIDWSLSHPDEDKNKSAAEKRRATSCFAGFSGAKMTALLAKNNLKWYNDVSIEDLGEFSLHVGDAYGIGISNTPTDRHISFYYEEETQRIYVESKAGTKRIVTDLDDPGVYFTEPIKVAGSDRVTGAPFKGFTTGEVYLSIYAQEFYDSSMKVEISDICGIRGTDLHQNVVSDNTAPTIEIDRIDNIVGDINIAYGEAFKVFNATASDLNGIANFNTYVWYNYHNDKKTIVGCQDGKFIPKHKGVYTIEYVAVDYYGNKTVRTVDLKSTQEQSSTIIFNLESFTDLECGRYYSPIYTVKSLNGDVEIKKFIVFNGVRTQFTDEFYLENVGQYQIVFEYTDGIVDGQLSYSFNAIYSDVVVITEPILPTYFIKGATYTLDYNSVVRYNGQNDLIEKPKVFVIEDGVKKEQEINYSNYTVNASQTVKFLYQSADGIAQIYSEEISVVDVGYSYGNIDMAKYFVGDFSAVSSSDDITFSSNLSNGDVKLDFANVVSLDAFLLTFSIPEALSNYGKLMITLSDYYDRDNYLSLTFSSFVEGVRSGIKITATNNLGIQKETSVYTPFVDALHKIQYSASSKSLIYNGDDKIGSIEVDIDKILFSITLLDVYGEDAGFSIKQVCNQLICNNKYDMFDTNIKTYDILGEIVFGGVVTIQPAVITDVLNVCNLENYTISVSGPDRKTVVSVDGVSLNKNCDVNRSYDIKLEQYGVYSIVYGYEDSWGNYFPKRVTIEVIDKVAPILTLADNYDENTFVYSKVGNYLNFVGFNVSDNITAQENIACVISVISPSAEIYTYDKNDKLYLRQAGKYKVMYYAVDEFGNFDLHYYTIIAQK